VKVTVYHYPNCSTCKKALKWLDAHGVEQERIDIVASPPSESTLRRIWKASGLPIAKLFNTSGQSYRQGGFKEKLPAMTEAEALAALAADGKLIKRPLVDGGTFAIVGFDEARFTRELG
jgi:arsenate reductase